LRHGQAIDNTYWGAKAGNVMADPGPRLQAYIATPQAKVRVLRDVCVDNQNLTRPRSNLRTVEHQTAVAQTEEPDLRARRRNSTGQGIHSKMLLAQIGGKGWVIVGSLNGGAVSTKLNRKMALLVGSDKVYDYLADTCSPPNSSTNRPPL
jgi:hypothetical protein